MNWSWRQILLLCLLLILPVGKILADRCPEPAHAFAPKEKTTLCSHPAYRVHKYLFTQANPVNGLDFSGHDDDLASLSVSEEVSADLDSEEEGVAAKIASGSARAKTSDVYVVATSAGAGVPLHAFIYVNRIIGNEGLRYDIGLQRRDGLRFGRGGFGRYLTIFKYGSYQVSATTLQQVKSESKLMYRIAQFTNGQWALWSATVTPLGMIEGEDGSGTATIPYSFLGYPFSFNCVKWTIEAASSALVMQVLPL